MRRFDMADRDPKIREACHHERGVHLIITDGRTITADSLRARLSIEHQQAIDAKLSKCFRRERDKYDADGLLNLGRRSF
jgi:hypothetical protein